MFLALDTQQTFSSLAISSCVGNSLIFPLLADLCHRHHPFGNRFGSVVHSLCSGCLREGQADGFQQRVERRLWCTHFGYTPFHSTLFRFVQFWCASLSPMAMSQTSISLDLFRWIANTIFLHSLTSLVAFSPGFISRFRISQNDGFIRKKRRWSSYSALKPWKSLPITHLNLPPFRNGGILDGGLVSLRRLRRLVRLHDLLPSDRVPHLAEEAYREFFKQS